MDLIGALGVLLATRRDRRQQHRDGRLADGYQVNRAGGSQSAPDIYGDQGPSHESTGRCCRERCAHHGLHIGAKIRDSCQ